MGLPEDKRENPRVLVVDDDVVFLEIAKEQLGLGEMEVVGVSGPIEAVAYLLEHEVDAVVSDYVMPVMNGLELLMLVRQSRPGTVCVLASGFDDIKMAAESIDGRLVHRLVKKPWTASELGGVITEALESGRGFVVEEELRVQIRRQACKALLAVAQAVDGRDLHTRFHSERVAGVAQVIGRAMELNEDELADLCMGALLHNVGMVGIDRQVLLKPGRLTEEEMESVRKHPQAGGALLESLEYSSKVADLVRQHHENYDGSGYPGNVGGEDVGIPARVIRVADTFEAMSAKRTFRPALSLKRIQKEFMLCRGAQFDPEVTDVLLGEMRNGRIHAYR